MKKLFKKSTALFLAVVMLSSLMVTGVFATETYEGEDGIYTYEVYDETATITYYSSTETDIVIPSEIDGYTVTEISWFAYSDCVDAVTITIPSTVTYISNIAFYGCESLEAIYVEEGNTSYFAEDGLLYHYSGDWIELILCPQAKTGDIEIYEGTTYVSGEYNMFDYCSGITSITIPASVTNFEVYSSGIFRECVSLENIYVDEANTEYSSIDGVLYSKDGTTLVVYPSGKTGDYVIPSTVTKIGSFAFMGCTGITGIEIPETVSEITWATFYGCTSLTSVVIQGGVTLIDYWAFVDCTSLKSVVIPTSVETIGDRVFDGCYELTDIYYTGTVDEWNAITFVEEDGYYPYDQETVNVTYNYVPAEEDAETELSSLQAKAEAMVDAKMAEYSESDYKAEQWAEIEALFESEKSYINNVADEDDLEDFEVFEDMIRQVEMILTSDELDAQQAFVSAIDNATAGDTITLTSDVILTDDSNVVITKDLTIDLNGYTIYSGQTAELFDDDENLVDVSEITNNNIVVYGDATLTIDDSKGTGGFEFDDVHNQYSSISSRPTTVGGWSWVGSSSWYGSEGFISAVNGADIVVNSVNIDSGRYAFYAFGTEDDISNVTINGGVFVCDGVNIENYVKLEINDCEFGTFSEFSLYELSCTFTDSENIDITVKINGGKFSNMFFIYGFIDFSQVNRVVTGGTFVSYDEDFSYTDYLATGYIAELQEIDGVEYYVVSLNATITTENTASTEVALNKDIESVFTDEDLESGEDLEVVLSVNEVSEVTEAEQTAIDKLEETYEVALILDIDLTKYVGTKSTSLTDLDEEITITIDIPEELQGKDLVVIRIHDGVAETLKDIDDSDETYTFKTDKFSTYALAEVAETEVDDETEEETDAPETGDNNVVTFVAIMMLTSLLAIAIISKKKLVK